MLCCWKGFDGRLRWMIRRGGFRRQIGKVVCNGTASFFGELERVVLEVCKDCVLNRKRNSTDTVCLHDAPGDGKIV